MTIPLAQAKKIIASFQTSRIQNLFAQSHAQHVLYEVKESPKNFPSFDELLQDKVTFTAYTLLTASCSIVEQNYVENGIAGLEKAASLLQNVNDSFAEKSPENSFHLLVSSMAFYAAGHYSRAFVSIRQVEGMTEAAGMIAAFIRKDTNLLIQRLSNVLLSESPKFEDQSDLDEWVITVAIARSFALVLEYVFTGNKEFLGNADLTLKDAYLIATTGSSPAHWLVVRLLRLMLNNLRDASLWQVLSQYFDQVSVKYLDQYIRLQAFSKTPVIELWTSQRTALSLALNPTNRGGVINLRTSAGKTRVAELAILQTLSSNPTSRIIYLAPFRSLAFEVERTLTSSFSWLGFQVSHLYGGARVSSVDTELVSKSSIIIATPEKARALFRAMPELFDNIKLFIIDEGHLIGPSDRYVKNELFVDHLRAFARNKGARILLLSAVLPNAQELAEWVTGDSSAAAISPWKPSVERFGLLRWNGSRVRIDWLGEVASFNPSFVEAKPLDFVKRKFPNNKNEAIAATAVRLSSIGPVMIFTGKAVSVPTLATATLLAFGENPKQHPWPEHEWKVFEASCAEELAPNAIEIQAARTGIICHSNRLTPQVRMAIERLMRSYPPRIIIATTTLAQGVNIGISSVIIASPYIGIGEKINKRDFWNICGRAGRAFVDGEGKILYVIDETKKAWQVRKDRKLAKYYFDASSTDRIESGLLSMISYLRIIADKAGVTFDLLIDLVANNDFSKLGGKGPQFEAILDLIDDELLALHEDVNVNPSAGDSIEWIEQAFRESLASIQTRTGVSQIDIDDVIHFLQARTKSTLKRVPDRTVRKSIIASDLPLSVALKAQENLDYFRGVADEYLKSEMSFSALVVAVQKIESWTRINALSITGKMPDETEFDKLREKWLGGFGLWKIIEKDSSAASICKDYYGYELSWIINAISQKLNKIREEERATALAQIALLVEIGVPTEIAARIFLAGIRSRVSATELSQLDVQFGDSVFDVGNNLRNLTFVKTFLSKVSKSTAEWLNLMLTDASQQRRTLSFTSFTLKLPTEINTLYVRSFQKNIFLCSMDGRKKILVNPSDNQPFNKIADNPRFVFERSQDIWSLVSRDPRYIVKQI